MSLAQKLSTPQNVRVVVESGLYLKIEWNDKNPNKRIRYIIIRTESGDINDRNRIEFRKRRSPLYDKSVKPGKRYFYHIIAVTDNPIVYSEPSEPVSGRLPIQATPKDSIKKDTIKIDTSRKR